MYIQNWRNAASYICIDLEQKSNQAALFFYYFWRKLLLLQGHHFQDLLTALKFHHYLRKDAISSESLLSELCAISFN